MIQKSSETSRDENRRTGRTSATLRAHLLLSAEVGKHEVCSTRSITIGRRIVAAVPRIAVGERAVQAIFKFCGGYAEMETQAGSSAFVVDRRFGGRQRLLARENGIGAREETQRLRFGRQREPPGRQPHAASREQTADAIGGRADPERDSASASGCPGARASTFTGRLSGLRIRAGSCAGMAAIARTTPDRRCRTATLDASCTVSGVEGSG